MESASASHVVSGRTRERAVGAAFSLSPQRRPFFFSVEEELSYGEGVLHEALVIVTSESEHVCLWWCLRKCTTLDQVGVKVFGMDVPLWWLKLMPIFVGESNRRRDFQDSNLFFWFSTQATWVHISCVIDFNIFTNCFLLYVMVIVTMYQEAKNS